MSDKPKRVRPKALKMVKLIDVLTTIQMEPSGVVVGDRGFIDKDLIIKKLRDL